MMYVQHSVDIDRPIAAATAVIVSGSREWFAGLDVADVALRRKIAVEVGDPVGQGAATEIPVAWRATFIERLSAVMVGEIELAPVDPRVTRVTVCGRYEPRMGALGQQLDEALMHAEAQATVRVLAEWIADRLDGVVSARSR